MRERVFNTNIKHDNKCHRSTVAINATVLSLAKKTRSLAANTNKTYFNKRSRENKCNYSESELMGRIYAKV